MPASKQYSPTVSDSGAAIRPDWLAAHREDAIDPGLPVIDAHHHLWDRMGSTYLVDDFYLDAESGHDIVASVYVEARAMYRADGPEALRSVGEVEFARGMAAIGASGLYGPGRVASAIVGMADLRRTEAAIILEELASAGGRRFRGVRQQTAWVDDPAVSRRYAAAPRGILADPAYRRGFGELARLGLSADIYVLHPQLPELVELARRFPATPIVLDHLGTPLGTGSYAGRRDEVFAQWRADLRDLARCPNVSIKLSGLGMAFAGFDFHLRPTPPTSADLAAAWGRYMLAAIEAFGVDRCMFASNFPPDKGSCSYGVLWNAFKRIVADFSPDEKRWLFAGSAKAFYRIENVSIGGVAAGQKTA